MEIKQKVKYSAYSVVMSALCFALLLGLISYLAKRDIWCWIIYSAVLIVWCLSTLYYAPMAISVDEKSLSIHRSLRIKDIPLAEIASVRLCPPTMAECRICGSGGFMGYWGWFRERDIGRYFAYYGRSSECFLVTLKGGKKYMLGCENFKAIVRAIDERIR